MYQPRMSEWVDCCFFLSCIINIPVDAAAAPINTGGIPSRKMRGAAMKHVILDVVDEEAERVLWWKSW